MSKLRSDTALALELGDAIRGGNILSLKKLLAENSGLARVCIVDAPVPGRSVEGRSLLHVLTDSPGNFPRGAATVALLVEAGADVNARFIGNHEETPLHWAASCDDVAVLDALLDHGADIEARGAVIDGGTPLADAVALGLMERVAGHFSGKTPPDTSDITNAFWCACHGGQRATAEFLLEKGAELNWKGYDNLTPLDAARRAGAIELAAWLLERGAASAMGNDQ